MKMKFSLENETRVDSYLHSVLSNEVSRSKICEIIKQKNLFIDEKMITKCSHKIVGEGEISFDLKFEENNELKKWNKKNLFEIIFENDQYLILNKPDDLSVHPGTNNIDKTLTNNLITLGINLSKINSNRPGIVHRLDKNTTGLMIIAKTENFHNYIQEQFEKRNVQKTYVGLVEGRLKYKKGEINAPIGRSQQNRKLFEVTSNNSKDALTLFEVIDNINGNDLVEFKLITGRTHQIRVHMKYIGNPLLNDVEYGKKIIGSKRKGQYLHSKEISFVDQNGQKVTYSKNISFDN